MRVKNWVVIEGLTLVSLRDGPPKVVATVARHYDGTWQWYAHGRFGRFRFPTAEAALHAAAKTYRYRIQANPETAAPVSTPITRRAYANLLRTAGRDAIINIFQAHSGSLLAREIVDYINRNRIAPFTDEDPAPKIVYDRVRVLLHELADIGVLEYSRRRFSLKQTPADQLLRDRLKPLLDKFIRGEGRHLVLDVAQLRSVLNTICDQIQLEQDGRDAVAKERSRRR